MTVERLAQAVGVDPTRAVTGRRKDACDRNANRIDVILGHRRQSSASPLPSALVAEFQLVENCAVLRVEEHQRRAGIRQRLQQR